MSEQSWHTIAKALADALEKQSPFFDLTESGKAAIAALASYRAAVAAEKEQPEKFHEGTEQTWPMCAAAPSDSRPWILVTERLPEPFKDQEIQCRAYYDDDIGEWIVQQVFAYRPLKEGK